jgi:ribonucleoside-diphosphate reductase alpha chain
MEKLGLWSISLKNKILSQNGSVQNIQEIPQEYRELYKAAHEMSQKWIIDHAAARGVFIDQSQSMNLFLDKPNIGKLASALMHAYKKGLKTLSYYVRTEIKDKAVKVGLENQVTAEEAVACSIDNPEDCEVCGS